MAGRKEVSKRHLIMTIPEVADYLKLSVRTVYEMARQGQIPCIKLGRQWRFRQADIYNLFVQRYYQRTKKKQEEKH